MRQTPAMEPMMAVNRVFVIGKAASCLVLALVLAACARPPILANSPQRPAQVLAPVSQSAVKDARARFREIFRERLAAHGGFDGTSEDYLHRLADEPESAGIPIAPRLGVDELRVFIVPGYFGDAVPGGMLPFGASVERLRDEGYRVDYLEVTGRGSSSHNAAQIAAQLGGVSLEPGEKLVLIGYSKGTIDVFHYQVEHPEQAERIDALVSVASPVNGTPLADNLSQVLITLIAATGGSEPGDKGGLDSVKRSVQMPWLAAHPLPSRPKYFSLVVFTDRDNISAILRDGWDTLAQIDSRNDGQIIFYDQVIPGAALLGYANADHWAIALPFTEQSPGLAATLMNRNAYPRMALIESILLYLRESL